MVGFEYIWNQYNLSFEAASLASVFLVLTGFQVFDVLGVFDDVILSLSSISNLQVIDCLPINTADR